jgi:hypothetical protein
MSGFFKRTRAIGLVSGVFAAALAGGMLSNVAMRWLAPADQEHPLAEGFFRAINAHATATNGQESLIIATGEAVDPSIEAVYTLDTLTGELRGSVLSPARGVFTIRYTYPSVAKDFDGVKNPRFLMVTGVAEMRQGYRGGKLCRSVVYVAEATSGKVVAYAAPWDQTKAASPQGFTLPLVRLDSFTAREAAVR